MSALCHRQSFTLLLAVTCACLAHRRRETQSLKFQHLECQCQGCQSSLDWCTAIRLAGGVAHGMVFKGCCNAIMCAQVAHAAAASCKATAGSNSTFHMHPVCRSNLHTNMTVMFHKAAFTWCIADAICAWAMLLAVYFSSVRFSAIIPFLHGVLLAFLYFCGMIVCPMQLSAR